VWFLREALAVEPGHVPAAVALADVYLARGEPASARDVALQTIRRASADGALWLRLARSRFALDDSDGAMEALREGLRHVPRDTLLLQTLVEASLRRGEWSRALSAQRALWSEADTRHDVDHVSIESALRVLLATSDRARGLRCDASLSIVRRALSRCAAHP
jgi:predicted Zn-dependent protease